MWKKDEGNAREQIIWHGHYDCLVSGNLVQINGKNWHGSYQFESLHPKIFSLPRLSSLLERS